MAQRRVRVTPGHMLTTELGPEANSLVPGTTTVKILHFLSFFSPSLSSFFPLTHSPQIPHGTSLLVQDVGLFSTYHREGSVSQALIYTRKEILKMGVFYSCVFVKKVAVGREEGEDLQQRT